MCPPDTPPAFFDVTAPHSSSLVVLWWLVPPLFILIPVWGNRRWLRSLPDGPARPSIAQLFAIAAGFFSAWVTLSAITLAWMDATNRWFASLPNACYNGIPRLNAMTQMFILQDGILVGACLLGFVGLICYLFAFQRYQRARRAASWLTL